MFLSGEFGRVICCHHIFALLTRNSEMPDNDILFCVAVSRGYSFVLVCKIVNNAICYFVGNGKFVSFIDLQFLIFDFDFRDDY